MSVIRVPQDAKTINEAVDIAKKGDTIKVSTGIYRESVTVDKERLKIVGNSCQRPIVIGTPSCGETSAFEIVAKGVSISNFIIRNNFGYGISINSSYCSIDNCNISCCSKSGIKVAPDVTGTLIQCTTSNKNAENGICCCGNNTCIIDCECNKNGVNGIEICGTNNLVLRCKLIKNVMNGIETCCHIIPECAMNLIIESKICYNGADGIKSRLNNNFILNNCIFCNRKDGIDTSDTSENSIIENKIQCNGGTGIKLRDGDNNRVVSNKIICNKCDGISIGNGGNDNSIDNNCILNNNKAGVSLGKFSKDNAVRDNFFECNDPNISAIPPANKNNFFSGNVKVNKCCC